MTLAVKPWRVKFRMHLTGDYWASDYFRTRKEALLFMYDYNSRESLLFACRPIVDHSAAVDEEKTKLLDIIGILERERRGV